MKKIIETRKAEKNSPMFLAQQTIQNKKIQTHVKTHTITISHSKGWLIVKDSEVKQSVRYDWSDKDGRRQILHRIWRYQQKATWKVVAK